MAAMQANATDDEIVRVKALMTTGAMAGAGCFPAFLLLLGSVLAILVVFTSVGADLTPRHRGGEGWVVAFSLALGVANAVVMLRPRPRTWRGVVRAVGASALVAFLWFPVAGITLERVQQMADFTNVAIAGDWRDLPIDRASIRHNKGPHYRVSLADYPVSLDVDHTDYSAAFGEAESIDPVGWCVHVFVQTAGRASRIMASNGLDLPAGSLVRCRGGR